MSCVGFEALKSLPGLSSFVTQTRAQAYSRLRMPPMFRDCGSLVVILIALGPAVLSFRPSAGVWRRVAQTRLAASEEEIACDVQAYLDPKTKSQGVIPDVVPIVGEPQALMTSKNYTIDSILKELAAIQQQGPKTYCILGTRHCSFLHQQIIELLAYALVLSGNHVYTSGAGGTNAAAIRGALRAGADDLLTVVLPQSISKQPAESQKLLSKVKNIVEMTQNDHLSLDVASRLCNSDLLSRADQLIAFAFHNSLTVIEATKEAQSKEMVVTVLYLD